MKISQTRVPDIVRMILRRLKGAGFAAYIVGGAVRDMVMGRKPTDWDVATSAAASDLGDLFPRLKQFSLQHGTVTLVHEGEHYEVSAFRGPSPTIGDDLAHRDFTINAMAWEPDDEMLIDPWGGSRDLALRIVRSVGAPEDRFREDPLRLLRAARLCCELGFRIHRKTRESMSGMAPMLATVAKERVRDELMGILASEKPSLGFRTMVRANLVKEVLPELHNTIGPIMEAMDRMAPDPVLRLAALFHDIAEPGAKEAPEVESARIAEAAMRRLRFSERLISQVTHLVRHHRDAINYHPSWDEGAVRRLVRKVGAEQLELFFFLCRGCLESQGKDARLLSDLEDRVKTNLKTGFPRKLQDLRVDGRKVMEICGINGGPEVGRVLEALLEEVLDHPEWNTEEKLVERLKEMRLRSGIYQPVLP